MGKLSKKLVSIVTSVAIATSLIFTNLNVVQAEAATTKSSEEVLQASSVEKGVILHAWCWSFNEIKNNLDEIAAAGYTSIQTSPVQACVVGNGGDLNNSLSNTNWYYHYQPTYYTIGNYQLGNEAEFKALCSAAHEKGLKIIVDVVGNHVSSDSGAVDSELYNNCHNNGKINNWSNRYQVTQGDVIGLRDLNTGSSIVQNKMANYVKGLMNAGADGLRFDAAKSIELPEEKVSGVPTSQYWNVVMNAAKSANPDVFIYGEVLQGDEPGTNFQGYAKYMKVSGTTYGWYVRAAVGYAVWEDADGNLHGGDGSSDGKLEPNINPQKVATKYVEGDANDGSIPNSKVVSLVETHDTYANGGASRAMSQKQIQLAWAMVASRSGSVPLYFNRPTTQSFGNDYLHPSGEPYKRIGEKGSDDFKNKDVVEMNKFHNLMEKNNLGEAVSPINNNKVFKCERGNLGMVLVNVGGSTSINTSTSLPNGTYENRASYGGTFTVNNGTLTGNMEGSSIAILYEGGKISTEPEATISQAGGEFTGNSLNVTFGLKNATSGTYKIGNESAVNFTSSKSVSIGSDLKAGESVTVTLTATDGTKNYSKSYTFTKVETPISTGDIYIQKPSDWGDNINVYVYKDKTSLATWPGTAMKNEGNGLYSFDLPDTWGDCLVLFNDGNKQYPGSGQPGLEYKAGTKMIYKDGKWSQLEIGLTISDITADKSEATAGETVTFTASAKNGTSPYTYEYEIKNSNNQTQNITANNEEAVWETTKDGTYTVKCTVTDNSGKTATKSINYIVKARDEDKPLIEKITSSLSGSNITYSVKATGGDNIGNGLLFYKFYIVNSDGSEKIGQNYSLKNTFTTSKSNTKIRVEVQNSYNDTVSQEYKYSEDPIDEFEAGMKLSLSSPQEVGKSIKITGTSEKGVGTVKYKISVTDSDGNTSVIKSLSSTTYKTWVPKEEGTYTITVYAIDEEGNSDSVSEKYIISNPGEISIDSYTASLKSPQAANTAIKLSCEASGAQGTINYSFVVKNSNTRTVVADYSTSNTAVWKPTSAGTYTIYFKAKDTKADKEVMKKMSYTITEPVNDLKISSFKASVASPQAVGSSIKLTAATTGAKGTVKYKFIASNTDTGEKSTIAGYSTSRTATWTPTKAGNYKIYVKAYDSRNKEISANISYVINVSTFKISSATIKSSSPQSVGTSIKMSVSTSGGQGTVKTRILAVNTTTGDKTEIKAYSTSTSATWKPTVAGNYKIYFKAKDNSGKEIQVKKSFIVNHDFKITKFVTSLQSPQKVKTSIRMAATVSGASGTVKYRYIAVSTKTGAKTVIQDYATNKTVTWKPKVAGTYKLYAQVKDENGTVKQSIIKYVVK